LSNNFPAQNWCKDEGDSAWNCWLPYSMQADGECFSHGDMQWNQASGDQAQTELKGGSTAEVLLEGYDDFSEVTTSGDQITAVSTLHTGSVAVTGGGALAVVVGVGAWARKRRQRKQPAKQTIEDSTAMAKKETELQAV